MLRITFIALLVLCLSSISRFANAVEQINNINVSQSLNKSRIEFHLSGAATYKNFMLVDPWRLVVDFEGVNLKTSIPSIDKNNPHIKLIRTGEPSSKKNRFVFELKKQLSSSSTKLLATEIDSHRVVFELIDTSALDKVKEAYQEQLKDVSVNNTNQEPNVVITASSAKRELVVAIDAGHGGADPGAIGYAGSREKELTLQIAKKLKAAIDQNPLMRAVLIRQGDRFIELHNRRLNARNLDADIFLSIHADAFTKQSARGFSVFALSQRGATSAMARALAAKANAADLIGGVSLADKDQVLAQVLVDLSMTNTINESVNLGGRVLQELSKLGKLHSKRVEQAGFAVLKSPDMPSILIETGFITNPQDEKNLRSSSYQNKVVNAIYTAIDEYYKQTPYFSKSTYASPTFGNQGSVSQANSGSSVYTVKRGDSLSKISAKYNITISALKRFNNLSKSTVYVGQKIKLPGGVKVASSKPSVHIVKRGDTLSEIAEKYSIRVSDLKRLNNLSKNTVYVGQKIKLSGNAHTTIQKVQYHKVKRGDTLSEIAEKYNVSVKQIKSLNKLRSENIRLGQRLKVSS